MGFQLIVWVMSEIVLLELVGSDLEGRQPSWYTQEAAQALLLPCCCQAPQPGVRCDPGKVSRVTRQPWFLPSWVILSAGWDLVKSHLLSFQRCYSLHKCQGGHRAKMHCSQEGFSQVSGRQVMSTCRREFCSARRNGCQENSCVDGPLTALL